MISSLNESYNDEEQAYEPDRDRVTEHQETHNMISSHNESYNDEERAYETGRNRVTEH